MALYGGTWSFLSSYLKARYSALNKNSTGTGTLEPSKHAHGVKMIRKVDRLCGSKAKIEIDSFSPPTNEKTPKMSRKRPTANSNRTVHDTKPPDQTLDVS
jgi:hypothetical protein